MSTSQNTLKVANRNERHTYEGKFQDFQTFGNSFKGKRYSSYEKDPYNQYQNFLYKRALFGLKTYSQEEIKEMHPQKCERITRVNIKAQRELNLWKQEKIIEATNKLFSLFTRSSLAKDLINLYSKPDPKFTSKLNFKDLGINKEDIIDRLIQKKVLPTDFLTLKQQ